MVHRAALTVTAAIAAVVLVTGTAAAATPASHPALASQSSSNLTSGLPAAVLGPHLTTGGGSGSEGAGAGKAGSGGGLGASIIQFIDQLLSLIFGGGSNGGGGG
jgi:hypothetical protein